MRENTEIDNFLQKRHNDMKGNEYIENLTVVLNEAKVSRLCHSRIMRKESNKHTEIIDACCDECCNICMYLYICTGLLAHLCIYNEPS